MKLKKNKKKKGKTKKGQKRSLKLPKKLFESPVKVWNILLVFFVALNVFMMVVSLYLFLKVGEEDAFVSDDSSNLDSESIERADLERVVNEIERRGFKFDRIAEEGVGIIDPAK